MTSTYAEITFVSYYWRGRDCAGEEMRTGRKKKHEEQMVFFLFNFVL